MACKTPRADLQPGMVQIAGAFHGVVTSDAAPGFPFPGWSPHTGSGTQKYWVKTDTITSPAPDSLTATYTYTVTDWRTEPEVVFSGDQPTWDFGIGMGFVLDNATETTAEYSIGGWTRVITLSTVKTLAEYEAALLDWQKDAAASLDSFMLDVATAVRSAGVSGRIVVGRHSMLGSAVPPTLASDHAAALDAAQEAEDDALAALEAAAEAHADALQSLQDSFDSRMAQVVAFAKAARSLEAATVLRDHWKARFDHLTAFIAQVVEKEPDDAEQSTLDEYAAKRDFWQKAVDARTATLQGMSAAPAATVVPSFGQAWEDWLQAKAVRIAIEQCSASVTAAAGAGDEETVEWFEATGTSSIEFDAFGHVWPVVPDLPTGFLAIEGESFRIPQSGTTSLQGDGRLIANVFPDFGRYQFRWNDDIQSAAQSSAGSMLCATGTSLPYSWFDASSGLVGRCLLGEVSSLHPDVGGWTLLNWGDASFDFGDPAQPAQWFRVSGDTGVSTWEVPAHRLTCAHAWLADPELQLLASMRFASYELNPSVCDLYLEAVAEFLKQATPSSPQRYGIYRVKLEDNEQVASSSGDYGFYALRRSMVPLIVPIPFTELLLPPSVLSKAWTMRGTYGEFWNQALVLGNDNVVERGKWNRVKVTLSTPMLRSLVVPMQDGSEAMSPPYGSGRLVLPASRALSAEWLGPVTFGAPAADGVQRVMRYLVASDLGNLRAEWRELVLPPGTTEWNLVNPVCEFIDRSAGAASGCYLELVS